MQQFMNQLLLSLAQEFRDYRQDRICIAKVLLIKIIEASDRVVAEPIELMVLD
jgi:hypothetical protein